MRQIKVELIIDVPAEIEGEEITKDMIEEWINFETGANGSCSRSNILSNYGLCWWGVEVENIE